MPNWYTTQVTAKGNEADLDRIVAAHMVPSFIDGEERMFDFNTVIPVPEALKDTRAYKHHHGDGTILAHGEYERSDWYKWVNANWSGETWNRNVGVERKPGELKIYFTTRWSPPVPVLYKLREIYPSVEFEFRGYDHMDYDSPDMDIVAPKDGLSRKQAQIEQEARCLRSLRDDGIPF